MPSDVYTCTEFLSRLPTLLHRSPRATTLVLQLSSPLTAPARAGQTHGGAGDNAVAASSTVFCHDDASDLVTFYAVFTRQEASVDDGEPSRTFTDPPGVVACGDPSIQAVCILVGHASHVTLQWCGQLQHVLSVTSLLGTDTHTLDDAGASFLDAPCSVRDERVMRGSDAGHRSTCSGVTALLVHLSPYCPPLQWDRYVDGVLGSQQVVCASYRCLLSDAAERKSGVADANDNDGDDDAAWHGAEAAESDAAHGASAGASEHLEETTRMRRSAPHPTQRQRCEPSLLQQAERRSSDKVMSPPLPFRVAAVLNGNVPLPQRRDAGEAIWVLFLVACDGCSLTAATAAPSVSAPYARLNMFDLLCDFLADEVVPAVGLDVVDGTWARDEAGQLLRDVCGARGRLGNSFAIRLPSRLDVKRRLDARSVIFVVDVSTPLLDILARSRKEGPAALYARTRCSLARQVAHAVQETLGRLVSNNIDAFSFPLRIKGDGEAAAALESPVDDTSSAAARPVGGSAQQLTREMLCRSIADSVSRIVSLSPHAAFRAEVTRLLWGTEGAGGPPVAIAGEGAGPVQLSASAVQRRIQECLLALSPE